MNFGDFLDHSNSCGGARVVSDLPYHTNHKNIMSTAAAAAISQPMAAAGKPPFKSPGLSLALQTGMEGGQRDHQLGVRNIGSNNSNNNFNHGDYENVRNVNGLGRVRSRDELDVESRSGSDNMDGGGGGSGSGDDHDGSDKPPRKKRYHRHTPQQIQELETYCPLFSPFDFLTQLERHENSILRQENDKLRAENMAIKDAMRNPICTNCGGPALIGEISLEEQHLRIENARLKDELDRVCALASKFLGRPISSLGPPVPSSSLEFVGLNNMLSSGLPLGPPDFPGPLQPVMPPPQVKGTPIERSLERSMYLELALAAMDELVKMAQMDGPVWVGGLEGGWDVLDREEYLRAFSPCIGMRPNGFVSEASRETGMVIINSLALVETLMDSNKWAEMFPCIIARTTTTDVISDGMGGTRNGALQLMQAELQVLSPLVPVREVNFLRFCKQHAEGLWAVVDVSIDTIREASNGGPTYPSCRRLPSGCVVQDMPNGYSKVTWVEHAEYDESQVHHLYRPSIAAGLGFGARRWVATLQRQCECLAILMSSSTASRDHSAITAGGRRSMLKLAQRMTNNFCAGVCASTVHEWSKLSSGNVDEDVRVMTRKSMDDPGEPPGVVLSAATSVWLPVCPQRLFDFLRNEHLRSEWDILSNGGPMQEMAHIAKGQDQGNCVSLLRAGAMNSSQNSMLILQETCTDSSGSLVVYAPVDVPAMHVVMNGGDSAYVALLPSGFAISPDGPNSRDGPGGSLLTVAFQILVNSLPTAKLTVESVETVNNLISCTVQKIKAALQ
ncbi:homeobox-leucine zipper protein HDG1 [Striga asiatica]|uniref:Homeobox-leucine zipper protein HDG1 n=1 Tax=Striga asiatica TaxID=4170 RepID=A0A5A7QM10_STRAF|nr:homeobox-leucine zipper protein HDG1 [Striga asiatica]